MRTVSRWFLGAVLAGLVLSASAAAADTQNVTITVPSINFLTVAGGPVNFSFGSEDWSTDPQQPVSDISSVKSQARTLLWLTNAVSPGVNISVKVDDNPPDWVHFFKVSVGTPTAQAGSGSCGTAASSVDLTSSPQVAVSGTYQKVCVAPVTYQVAVDLDGAGTYSTTVTWTIGP